MKKRTPGRSRTLSYDRKRSELTIRIADALLAAGVAQIPLRDLASRLGTSDRMLLYYFRDKEELVETSLLEVSSRLATLLGAKLSSRRTSAAQLLGKAAPLLASPAVAPFMTVWADISARASRGEEPFRTLARDSVRRWMGWLEARLGVEDGERRRDMAAAILTILEGARLLEVSLPNASQRAIEFLSGSLNGGFRRRVAGSRRRVASKRRRPDRT